MPSSTSVAGVKELVPADSSCSDALYLISLFMKSNILRHFSGE